MPWKIGDDCEFFRLKNGVNAPHVAIVKASAPRDIRGWLLRIDNG